MSVEQVTQTRLDELNLWRDLSWSTSGDIYRNGPVNPAENEQVFSANEVAKTKFDGLIHAGQVVFLIGDQSIGRIVQLLPGATGEISYLVIHPTRLWGHPKLLSMDHISNANIKGVWLSIDRLQFQELPNYVTDAALTREVDRALWDDEVLRVTDYHEIDVQVIEGVVTLSGHIMGMMNQDRIVNAIRKVKGILGLRIHLVADDKLMLKVSLALSPIEHVEGNHIFAKVQNGVVVLSGKVISIDVRTLAEQSVSSIPWVRGVINTIAAPGINLDAEDQRFFQPAIGEEIFFRDSLYGIVKQVVINENNRRVVDMIIQGKFPDMQWNYSTMSDGDTQAADRLAVIPVDVIRYLTSSSGFLTIDSTDTTRYKDFDPASFVDPSADWVPPYPYHTENVRFFAKS